MLDAYGQSEADEHYYQSDDQYYGDWDDDMESGGVRCEGVRGEAEHGATDLEYSPVSKTELESLLLQHDIRGRGYQEDIRGGLKITHLQVGCGGKSLSGNISM